MKTNALRRKASRIRNCARLVVPLDSLNPWDWSEHTLRVLAVLGTVGAVIVAVSLATLRGVWRSYHSWSRRPQLTLAFDPKTDFVKELVQFTPGARKYAAIYARLRVWNETGRRAAQGVQVLVTEIVPVRHSENIAKEGWRTETLRNFGALGWTHSDPPGLTLGPGATRTVDFGSITDTNDPVFTLGIPANVKPVSGFDRLPAGRYEVTLSVVGQNFNAKRWKLTVDYDGMWVMANPPQDHLKISVPQPA